MFTHANYIIFHYILSAFKERKKKEERERQEILEQKVRDEESERLRLIEASIIQYIFLILFYVSKKKERIR